MSDDPDGMIREPAQLELRKIKSIAGSIPLNDIATLRRRWYRVLQRNVPFERPPLCCLTGAEGHPPERAARRARPAANEPSMQSAKAATMIGAITATRGLNEIRSPIPSCILVRVDSGSLLAELCFASKVLILPLIKPT